MTKYKPDSLRKGLRCDSCHKKFNPVMHRLTEEELERHLKLEKKLSSMVKRVDLELEDEDESFNENIEFLEKTPSDKLSKMKQDVEEVVEELDGLVDEKFFQRDQEEIDYIKSAQGKHKEFKKSLNEKTSSSKKRRKKGDFKFLLLDDEAYEKKNKTKTPFSALNTFGIFIGSLACLALVVLFMYQLYLRNQSEWHNSETLRPVVEQVAAITGQKIADKKDVKQIHLLSTDMLPHPKRENAVVIQVQLINKATFAQFYPWFEVSITNLNGKVLARRNVGPKDYLSADQQRQKIKSKEFKKINIQMLALPEDADGYEIRLLNK